MYYKKQGYPPRGFGQKQGYPLPLILGQYKNKGTPKNKIRVPQKRKQGYPHFLIYFQAEANVPGDVLNFL